MEQRNYLIFLMCSMLVNKIHCNYATNESALLKALRNNYEVDHRPSGTTTITASISVFALNKLDIGAEVMSMTVILISVWHDPRLTWNASEHSGIQQIVVPTKYVWTPPLVVENEVNNVGILGSDGSPLRLRNTGIVMWTPPISTTTSCSVDITYYPYDKQICSIILTGWSYTVDEMNLIADTQTPIILDYFAGNGEWEILETGYELFNLTNGPDIYRKVYFKMTLRRKWQFYGLNVIIPIILNSFLMPLVFVVPLQSGEKMGYCLTVLLSYTVLLTMVSEDLPSISSQPSVIQIYLCVVMCLGTAGAVCTTGVLRLYNKDERRPVPRWLQNSSRYILAPISCQDCKSRRVTSPSSKDLTKQSQSGEGIYIYTYKEIAQMLDIICFRLFTLVMLSLTFSFLITLKNNY